MNFETLSESLGPKVKANGDSLVQTVAEREADVVKAEALLAEVVYQKGKALEIIKAPSEHSLKALERAYSTVAAAEDKEDHLTQDLEDLKESLSFAQNGYARWFQSLTQIMDLKHRVKQEQEYYKLYELWCDELLQGNKTAVKPKQGPITRSLNNQIQELSHNAATH